MQTVAKHIYNKLYSFGVKDVFIYSGGANLALLDQFSNEHNIHKLNYYVSANENCGSASAVGYAKSSSKLGVVITTSGPGLTNTLTSILDAQADSTPLLVISGQVPLKAMNTNAFQEAPSTQLTKPITKFSYLIKSPDEVDDVFNYAYTIAMDGKKGAVHIDLPKCVLNAEIKNISDNMTKQSLMYMYRLNNLNKIQNNSKEKFKAIAKIINESDRPIIIAGKGCNLLSTDEYTNTNYHASNRLRDFVQTANIPITTTLHGLGCFDEKDHHSLKMLGMHGSYCANMAIQNADVILAISSRFDDRTTGAINKFAPKAKNIIHINIDESDINKVIKTNHNLNMSCEDALKELNQIVTYKPREKWFNQLQKWKLDHPFEFKPIKGKLLAQQVLTELDKLIDSNRDKYIFTTGVGNHQMYTAQFLTHRHPNRLITSGSLGVMGSGIVYAIGAQIANPNKSIICIDGDASFNMSLNDLLTIKRYNLPIKIIIMNNSSQDMVLCWQKIYHGSRIVGTDMIDQNFNAIGKAYGLKTLLVNSMDTIKDKLTEFLNYDKSILLNCIVEKDYCLPFVKPGSALDDMVLLKNFKESFNEELKGEAPS